MKIFSVIIAIIVLCILTEANVMATEEPKFKLVEKSGDFELRLYDPVIVAETYVQGSLDEASNAGFRLIAGYIFGANKSRNSDSSEKISMTAPVIVEDNSQKIAMTAPVIVEYNAGKWRVQFVMPSAYTLGTLPVPNDTRVSLREIPAQKIAAIVFSGFAGETKIQEKTTTLLEWMKTKGLNPLATPKLARYNPPWTLPFLRRNEILVNY
jgi:hypothetical protein